ncbi:hypothetical protein AMJ86_04135 [bacterium SM23_57]|nr:MAG: hypothetical protein AMJ86_04135 [bacterium SM23_57]
MQEALTGGFQGRIAQQESLAKHTTYQIGGPADLWIEPDNLQSLQIALGTIAKLEIPYLIIGEGSNLLISDRGLQGVAVKLGKGFNYIKNQGNKLFAGAATTIKELSQKALDLNLDGLASICGIPGALGGGIVMNAGAYGANLSDHLDWVETIEPGGSLHRMKKKDITFSYRRADELQGKIVTAMSFQLTRGNREAIQTEMNRVERLRSRHQPLEWPSAGSVFKRPPGDYAGRILEEVGAKGFSIGGAEVSTKHANFIINRGSATAADVLAVIKELRRRVRDSYGIELEMEIKKVGFGPEEEKS